MRYYSKELYVHRNVINTAGVKARDDLDQLLEEIGFQPLPILYEGTERLELKLSRQIHIFNCLKAGLAPLRKGDLLFIQFPFRQNTILLDLLIGKMHREGVRYILLLHDLESIRQSKRITTSETRRLKTRVVEEGALRGAFRIIVHNQKMLELLVSRGVDRDKLVTLEIFDYLIPNYDPGRRKGKIGKEKPVIIAANLRPYKAAYAYKLPANCNFNLYGVDFSGELNLGSRYFGAFPPDELPYVMSGSFGLVWDGESADTCSGIFGEYMRLNCPHKISLYLAAGIPVAIWSEAAMADFVLRNKVGITVDSLHDLRSAIDRLSNEEYAEMVKNAEAIGARLRAGYYTRKAVAACRAAEGDSRT